jgi:hypothetical protein
MSSSKYVQYAVQNVQDYLAVLPGDQKLLKKAFHPFSGGYKPKIDESPELDPTRANFYQSHIGIMRWYVEFGRIDIITELYLRLIDARRPPGSCLPCVCISGATSQFRSCV